VGEPLEIAEPPVDENVDLDAQDLLAAEEEATHELDGFQVEEATEVTREEAEDLSEKTEASDDPYRTFREELRKQPGKWYVVHSYAGYERRVKQNIEENPWLRASSYGHDRGKLGAGSSHPSSHRLCW